MQLNAFQMILHGESKFGSASVWLKFSFDKIPQHHLCVSTVFYRMYTLMVTDGTSLLTSFVHTDNDLNQKSHNKVHNNIIFSIQFFCNFIYLELFFLKNGFLTLGPTYY